MSAKIQCGGLMERRDLCLVEVLGFEVGKGTTRGILAKFGGAGISLNYLTLGSDADGRKNMSFCVSTAAMAENRDIIAEIEAEFQPRRVQVNAPVSILTLYGPHFMERPNLLSDVFRTLCADEVHPLTVGTSVNSISVVIDIPDRDRAVECLRRKFEWPE
jgi:aspartokinase